MEEAEFSYREALAINERLGEIEAQLINRQNLGLTATEAGHRRDRGRAGSADLGLPEGGAVDRPQAQPMRAGAGDRVPPQLDRRLPSGPSGATTSSVALRVDPSTTGAGSGGAPSSRLRKAKPRARTSTSAPASWPGWWMDHSWRSWWMGSIRIAFRAGQ